MFNRRSIEERRRGGERRGAAYRQHRDGRLEQKMTHKTLLAGGGLKRIDWARCDGGDVDPTRSGDDALNVAFALQVQNADDIAFTAALKRLASGRQHDAGDLVDNGDVVVAFD